MFEPEVLGFMGDYTPLDTAGPIARSLAQRQSNEPNNHIHLSMSMHVQAITLWDCY